MEGQEKEVANLSIEQKKELARCSGFGILKSTLEYDLNRARLSADEISPERLPYLQGRIQELKRVLTTIEGIYNA